MRRRADRLRILYAIADELNGTSDTARALERMLTIVTKALRLRSGWIWLLDPDSERFYLAASHDLPPYLREPVRMSGSWCECTQSFRDGRLAARNVDVIECSRLAPAVADKLTKLTGGLRYHASVPLYFRDRPLGIMNLTGPRWRRLSASELRLLGSIAVQAGAAVERTRLAREGARLARTQERTRLAREIHDTLAQRLTAIALQLEGGLKRMERDGAGAQLEFARALDIAREGVDEARGSMLALRGAPPAGDPLPQALESLARRFTSSTGIRARVQAASIAMPAAVESELLAIARESLTNVRKHARATEVSIDLARRGARVELSIRDDGAGYARSRAGRGQGIVGMRERARLAGGALTIAGARGRGTRVTASIPLRNGGA
ncbi:MAG: GAF domain-containing sensor histidine kinase [Candidatus Eremiobacteraeota bacterium]|nr:GAF domain-containing sensor histidine kinase [Candidatus Eremiobacteraeota bacterium]MBV8366378.1 GAF domain-containing sensor histidine kinase [Candidatus Eremiobacteraeota bacterium]